MNLVVLSGRLTKDIELRYSQSNMAVGRFTLAVDRRAKQGEEKKADFVSCLSFDKTAEVLEKYCRKGTKISIEGRIQTGSYTKQDGTKVYTTDVIVNSWEFAQPKDGATDGREASQKGQEEASAKSSNIYSPSRTNSQNEANNDFMSIPDGIEDEIPFN